MCVSWSRKRNEEIHFLYKSHPEQEKGISIPPQRLINHIFYTRERKNSTWLSVSWNVKKPVTPSKMYIVQSEDALWTHARTHKWPDWLGRQWLFFFFFFFSGRPAGVPAARCALDFLTIPVLLSQHSAPPADLLFFLFFLSLSFFLPQPPAILNRGPHRHVSRILWLWRLHLFLSTCLRNQ